MEVRVALFAAQTFQNHESDDRLIVPRIPARRAAFAGIGLVGIALDRADVFVATFGNSNEALRLPGLVVERAPEADDGIGERLRRGNARQ